VPQRGMNREKALSQARSAISSSQGTGVANRLGGAGLGDHNTGSFLGNLEAFLEKSHGPLEMFWG
jgi:hypothetical protein